MDTRFLIRVTRPSVVAFCNYILRNCDAASTRQIDHVHAAALECAPREKA